MHILLAPDSFKESLSAPDVARALKKGFLEALPDATFDSLPLGDGGEGTMRALASALKLDCLVHEVTGPFGEAKQMVYYRQGQTAFFEIADLVGLASIPTDKRNPLQIQTRGIGELIVYLAENGIQTLYIGIGGSASHDGGVGMAAGLGYQFLDQEGHVLRPVGASLERVARMKAENVPEGLDQLEVKVLTDVANPLCGPKGATWMFGGQKGLSSIMFSAVDQAMYDFYQKLDPSIIEKTGAGAGGGMAAGLLAFLKGEIVSGIDTCLDLLGYEELVKQADLVVVGEGRLDHQSLAGKAPIGVAKRTPASIPVIAICGSVEPSLADLSTYHIDAAFPIVAGACSLETAFQETEANLIRTARNVGKLLSLKRRI